jgi:hypothetical protein
MKLSLRCPASISMVLMNWLLRTGLLILVLVRFPLCAAVRSVTVSERNPVLDGRSFGSAGAYERVSGIVHFAVDPRIKANRGIADLDLAPVDQEHAVEFSANFYILQPKDGARSNGTALVEISNRGGKGMLPMFNFGDGVADPHAAAQFGDGFLLNCGFTLVWIGWEFDLPDTPGLLKFHAPVATDHGKTIIGLVRSEWTGDKKVSVISLGDRSQGAYEVADPKDPENKLYVRDRVEGPRTLVARSSWRFEDARHVALDGGFAPGRIYEVVYRAKDPVVAGLGFAAIRDFTAFLKHGANEQLGDEHERAKRAIGFGISQDGRFLRTLLYQGFNTDEQGGRVFDGVWAHVGGAGRGSFNERFAQPSRDGHPFMNVLYPVDVPPFDTESLLRPERAAGTVPKVFLTNGSYEYWGRCASLIHTTEDGQHDVIPPPESRLYFLAGSQHGHGNIPPHASATQNEGSVTDYRFAMRALLVDLEDWVAHDTEPPPSQIPLISAGQLVKVSELKFPSVAGIAVPKRPKFAYKVNFTVQPPNPDSPFPTLVPQVDGDGNETSGIRLPEIAVPLGTYTGWNLRKPSIGAPDELFSMVGSFIPFARDKAAREQAHDPRLSVEERYASEADFLEKIEDSARMLVGGRFLLAEDVASVRRRAEQEWTFVVQPSEAGPAKQN